jgi:hypothetical protein
MKEGSTENGTDSRFKPMVSGVSDKTLIWMNSKEKGRRWFYNKRWSETGYFRPTALTYEETADIKLRYSKGETFAQIALTYGVVAADVRRALGLEDTR